MSQMPTALRRERIALQEASSMGRGEKGRMQGGHKPIWEEQKEERNMQSPQRL